MMYGWGGHGWGVGMWIVMAVAMVIFWAIVVVGIVALVRYVGHAHDAPVPEKTDPEEILRTRLARGDIDEEEFRKRMAVLREKV